VESAAGKWSNEGRLPVFSGSEAVNRTAAGVAVGVGMLVMGVYVLLPRESVAGAFVFLGVQYAAAALILWRLARDRAQLPRYWALVPVVLLVYVASSTAWYLGQLAFGLELPFPSLADAGFLVAYAGLAAFLVAVTNQRERENVTKGRAALLDALILATAACSLLYFFALDAQLDEGGADGLTRAVAIAYPAITAVLLGLAGRLVISLGTTTAELLLAIGLTGELVADAVYGHRSAAGELVFGEPYFLGWMVAYTALAALALHPGLAQLTRPVRRPISSRLALLPVMLPAAVTPLLLALSALDGPKHDTVPVLLVACGITVCLIFVRLALLSGDLALQRRLSDQLADLAHTQERLAQEDPLTGVGNRIRLARALEHPAARRRAHALLIVDVDDFKAVNDTFGHTTGDQLLRRLAALLREVARPQDLVVRLGGDEFGVLLPDADEDDARALAERFLAALESPLDLEGRTLYARASVGVAAAAPGVGAEVLLRHADVAMYAIKTGEEPPGLAVFNPARHRRVIENLALASELGSALARDELRLEYQPIVELASGRIVGCEALLRWQHPRHGRVPPIRFIPLAERTGLIGPIGLWVLETACRQAARWSTTLEAPPYVSVNLSPLQFADPAFVEQVRDILDRTGLEHTQLVVELTETAMANEVDQVHGPLAELRQMGIRVYTDDFGTGYSSLGQLRSLPLDGVKIDRSFVAEITSSGAQWSMAITIVRMLRNLGLMATVEGVENGTQVAQVRSLGCTYGQGFHFARPIPSERIDGLLREREAEGAEAG
jgi:diguanylate cyclase (GGDEF)-like protein